MRSMIDSGEKGYKLPEQILFNSLVLYITQRKIVNVFLLMIYSSICFGCSKEPSC